jgi:hypothetical protein
MSETAAELSSFRRVAVALTIGSFSIAALMGIVALLGGGDFGEGQGRVLLTTLIVGCASVSVLCYLATAGTPWYGVGAVGGLVLIVPVVTSLLMVWSDWDVFEDDGLLKWFGVGAVLAGTAAQLCLLLAVAWDRNLGFLLWPTIGIAVLLAVYVSGMILNEADGDVSLRFMGVAAILDVLGTLVTIALAKFGRGAVAAARRSSEASADPLSLPLELEARLSERAAALGRSRAGLLAEAVERYLAETS